MKLSTQGKFVPKASARGRKAIAPRRRALAVIATASVLLATCSISSAVNTVSQKDLGVGAWQALWTDVLSQHVDSEGKVDFVSLRRHHSELDQVVAFVGRVDPVSMPAQFPTTDSRLAYYINAYNALAMYGVVTDGVSRHLGWLGRLWFFYLRTFTVGGRDISLYDLENMVIRPFGDARVHFALNCMAASCPRLPRTAFTTSALDRDLDAAAREFVNEPRNVAVDKEKREVILSAIFDFYTEDFLAHSPNLIAYINHYRAEPVPPNYGIEFAEYDWSTNDSSHPVR